MATRLSRLEEKRTKRQLILVIIGIIAMVIFIMTLGIPLLIRVSIFIGALKSNSPLKSEIDSIPPSAPIIFPIITATNSAQLKVEGYAEPESTLKLYVNGDEVKNIILSKEGNFSFNDIILDNGENSLYAIAVDQSNNEGPRSKKMSVVYEKTAPKIDLETPSEGQEFTKRDQTITIKGTTDIKATLYINDRFVAVSDNGSFNYQFTPSERENQIILIATDQAGNQTKLERIIKYNPD